MTEPEPLRDRLLRLRADALQQLSEIEILDPGLMRLVADTGAVLAALDEAEAAKRAAVQPR